MLEKLHNKKRRISASVLLIFLLSSFSIAAQASNHTFMMLEMQQHKAMGHDMSSHCQPVLCESVISLDNQAGYGLDTVAIIDLNALPAVIVSVRLANTSPSSHYAELVNEYDPPPLQLSGILRI